MGGFGYDKKSRPDLSNTGFSVERAPGRRPVQG